MHHCLRSFCSAVFRAARIVLFGLLGCHHILELRPEALDLTELIADLASNQQYVQTEILTCTYGNHALQTPIQLVDVL